MNFKNTQHHLSGYNGPVMMIQIVQPMTTILPSSVINFQIDTALKPHAKANSRTDSCDFKETTYFKKLVKIEIQ